jgi:4'-phosphopantetheinyl transferase
MIDSNTVELWLVDLGKCAPMLEGLERDVPRLAQSDRDRADAIGDAQERSHRVGAYVALRMLLERAAGPGIRRQPFLRDGGKPRLRDASAEFNLSHTEGLALIGVSRGIALGVDMEKARVPKMSPRRLEELIAVGAGLGERPLPRSGVQRQFIQAWTRLEAFTKARGLPLAETLAHLGLRGRSSRREPPALAHVEGTARRLLRESGLAVHDVRLPPGLQAAAAFSRTVRRPGVRLFPADRAGIDLLLAGPV